MCFAAGILLALSNALARSPDAGFSALAGFPFMFLSNKVIECHTKQETVAFGVTAAEGIGIHSLVDVIVYTVTFSISLPTGLLAGTGLVVYVFAEGVITYLVLLKGDVTERAAAVYAFFVASLTTPVGAFVASPLVSRLGDADLELVLGFVAGVLLYVSAHTCSPRQRPTKTVTRLLRSWPASPWRRSSCSRGRYERLRELAPVVKRR